MGFPAVIDKRAECNLANRLHLIADRLDRRMCKLASILFDGFPLDNNSGCFNCK
jgi:hypothetical protein